MPTAAKKHKRMLYMPQPLGDLFEDFAEYLEMTPTILATAYVHERVHVPDDLTEETVQDLFEPARRLLPTYLIKGGYSYFVRYYLEEEIHQHYEETSERLFVGVQYLARAAVVSGMALEMEDERFVPPPLEAS